VLNAIYAGGLRGFSSGCRPGRSPHEALNAVPVGLEKRQGNWGLDAALRECFDALAPAGRRQCIAPRMGAQRVVRHRQTWRQAGGRAAGHWHAPEAGTPHGGRGRPLAAHSSRPDVRDGWADRWRRHPARGDGLIVRYADDGMVGFAPRDDAERFGRALQERFGTFNRGRPPEKTRLSAFGRFAVDRRKRRAQGNPEPCAVLGLTPTGRQTRTGQGAVRRKPSAQRLRKTLQAVPETRRRRLPWPIPQQGAWLQSVRLGHERSYAGPRHGSLRTVFRAAIMR
jgi:RNA-directed DNA polymerase